MAAEDGRLVFPQLLADASHDGVEFCSGSGNGALESADLGGKSGRIQMMGFALGQYFVDAIRPRDHHTGRDRHSFKHNATVTVCTTGVNRGRRTMGQSQGT